MAGLGAGQAAQAVRGRAELRQGIGFEVIETGFETVQVHGSLDPFVWREDLWLGKRKPRAKP